MADRQYKRKYKKLARKYRKILMKQARTAAPWDWGFMTEVISTWLNYMRAYYKEGLNVGLDEEGQPTRLQTLNMAIQLFNAWDNCFNNFYVLVKEDEVERYKQAGWFVEEFDENSPSTQFIKKNRLVSMRKIQTAQCNDEMFNYTYEKNRKDFFNYLAEHIEEWWD